MKQEMLIMVCTCKNQNKLLACIKCPGSVNCPEFAGRLKKYTLENEKKPEKVKAMC